MKFEDLLIEKKFTGKSLAEKSGVSESTISQIKTGKRVKITAETAANIAEALEVSVKAILECIKGEE